MRSLCDWFSKVEWEGGIDQMVWYGGEKIVDEYDLPEDYKALYRTFAKVCEAIESLGSKLESAHVHNELCDEEAE